MDQNRDAQMLGLMQAGFEAELIAKLRSMRYYGGLPLDARTVTDELISTGGQVNEPPPSTPPPHRRSTGSGWRSSNKGRQDHAVRRLRPQRDFRAHRRMLSTRWAWSRSGGQVQRHRLLVEIARLFSGPFARLQCRARPHAGDRDRRDAGQPHADLASASPATAIPLRSASASSCT